MIFNNLLICLAAARLVAGHGAIIKAVGNKGGSGNALGIVDSTPRDGSRRDPFQMDSTLFGGANADACGETPGAGPNDPSEQISKVISKNNGLPKVTPGGMLMMTLHQVNGDGAGPYECMIDSSGTGKGGWTKIEVMTNVPGKKSRSRTKATDFPLTAKIKEGQECTGQAANMKSICMVRCQNKANGGPFGGCVPITMASEADDSSSTDNTEKNEEADTKTAKGQKESNDSSSTDNTEKNEEADTKSAKGQKESNDTTKNNV